MDELLKHLTEISIRQQQIVEHMATRQGETEREVAALRFTAAQRVPLPDPPRSRHPAPAEDDRPRRHRTLPEHV